MVLGLSMTISQCLLDDLINHDTIFSMHADASPVLTRLPESAIKRAVVYIEHTGVSHKQLVGCHAFVCQFLHLWKA